VTVKAALRQSRTLRPVAQRLFARAPSSRRRSPLDRPIGVKLELTHRCNLRCGFCFTDSPRRTLEGTPDISDETWLRVVEDAIATGVIEAVVTGGEPLLRKELALSVIETFAEAGVAVSLVTNGWFVDEAVADRIAAVDDMRVHVSVDGASPEVHDAVRGGPGSWRRAVRAIDLLLARGVPVQANHTINSANAPTLQSCLEHLWLLGPGTIGTATVVPIGAAARAGGWGVDDPVMLRELRRFRARGFGDVALAVSPPQVLPRLDQWAPAAMLVRPDGTVLIDSMHPFSFGSVDDGLATVWERINAESSGGTVSKWRQDARGGRRLAEAPVVPYRDEPLEVAGSRPPASPGRPRRGGALMGSPPEVVPGDLAEARALVEGLALARPYRLEDVRWTGSATGERYVRVKARGRTVQVNATTGVVMDACGAGTPGDAADALAARHPSIPRERLVRDALSAVRRLNVLGVLAPAGARTG
jgi:MoaA/NifB/PqqE/SkfB family radical SAM enzyme